MNFLFHRIIELTKNKEPFSSTKNLNCYQFLFKQIIFVSFSTIIYNKSTSKRTTKTAKTVQMKICICMFVFHLKTAIKHLNCRRRSNNYTLKIETDALLFFNRLTDIFCCCFYFICIAKEH